MTEDSVERERRTIPKLAALGEQWRARAAAFMTEAEHSVDPRDVVRFTAMASTLDWAARELESCIGRAG